MVAQDDRDQHNGIASLVSAMNAWMRMRERLVFTIQDRAEERIALTARIITLLLKNERLCKRVDEVTSALARYKIEHAQLHYEVMAERTLRQKADRVLGPLP